MRISDIDEYRNNLDSVIRNTEGLKELYRRNVLVTGAGGMLGSFIVDVLLRLNDVSGSGIMIYAAGRDTDRLKDRFGERGDLFFIRHDLLKTIDWDIYPDYVIHAAGNADPASFNTDPVGTMMGNVGGTHALLRYAKEHDCRRFLYVSSGEVYGQGRPDIDSYDETYSGYVDPVSVRSCYPMSKRAAENLCVSYNSEYSLETVVVRPCHIYGPGFKEGDSHAYVQFLKDALAGRDIVMKSAGTQTRSYVYVADCVSGILTALLKGNIGEAYNIANPNSVVSIAGLAQEIATTSGVSVVHNAPDEKDLRDRSPISRQVLKPDKLMFIGFRPSYDLSVGIQHTVAIRSKIPQ